MIRLQINSGDHGDKVIFLDIQEIKKEAIEGVYALARTCTCGQVIQQ